MLQFYQITDTHFYASEVLDPAGKAWEHRIKYDQKCVAESGAILDAATDYILRDRETQVVLVSGDLVCDGEREGHYAMREKLERLTAGGKRVYVLTATHDTCPYPKRYSAEKGEYPAEGLPRSELLKVYWEFGPASALSVHEKSFSYVAQIAPGYRLFALNDDGIGWERGFHGYDEDQLQWLREQLETAKESGDVLLAMGHHPLLPPNPFYGFFSPDDLIGNHVQIASMFADAGVHFMFTGHTHMQNIGYFDSERGNRIFDINTGSLICYPSPIRHMTLTDKSLTVKTDHLTSINWDLGGKSYMQYSLDHFEFMLRDILDAAANDIRRFCEIAPDFGLPSETAWKLRVPIRFAGKLMEKLTFQKAGRLLWCASKIAPEMRNVYLRDFVLALIRNMYGGDEPYKPGSPEYESFMALYHRLRPLLRRVIKGVPIADLDTIVEGLLYDGGYPDSDAVLPVPNTKS